MGSSGAGKTTLLNLIRSHQMSMTVISKLLFNSDQNQYRRWLRNASSDVNIYHTKAVECRFSVSSILLSLCLTASVAANDWRVDLWRATFCWTGASWMKTSPTLSGYVLPCYFTVLTSKPWSDADSRYRKRFSYSNNNQSMIFFSLSSNFTSCPRVPRCGSVCASMLSSSCLSLQRVLRNMRLCIELWHCCNSTT